MYLLVEWLIFLCICLPYPYDPESFHKACSSSSKTKYTLFTVCSVFKVKLPHLLQGYQYQFNLHGQKKLGNYYKSDLQMKNVFHFFQQRISIMSLAKSLDEPK